MVNKIKNKILRIILKMGFPNNVRIWALKKLGAQVGNDVYIAEGFTIAGTMGREKYLYIEDRVSIAPNVIVILGSHPNNSNLRYLKEKYKFIEIRGKVMIKHDAWIGAGAIILPNVTIGEYAIIGAGSVVTKDVSPYTVVAGVPARPIKKILVDSEGGNNENPF